MTSLWEVILVILIFEGIQKQTVCCYNNRTSINSSTTALRSMIKVYLKVDIVHPWNTCPYGIQTPPSIQGKKGSFLMEGTESWNDLCSDRDSTVSLLVHPQNVRLQNIRFQNSRFQNFWNVRFTKRQVYKTSGLQNVRFTKRQVFKTSGCKKTSISILYLWLVEIRRFCCSHVSRQSDGCVLFSILEGCFAIYLT